MERACAITALQEETVTRWHVEPVENLYAGFLGLVCEQHKFNFLLWHEEDIARSPDVADARIVQCKRAIDRYNQQRNDCIEKLDDALRDEVARRGIQVLPGARLNTETPGSVIDRLSILALRIYHMREQAERPDAAAEHRIKASERLAILRIQRDDLANGLDELLADIAHGRKHIKSYRQFKMYNDPTMNPYLYNAKRAG